MRLVRLSLAAAWAIAAASAASAQSAVSIALAPNEVLLEVSAKGIVRSRADTVTLTAAARSEAPTIAAARQANAALVARLVATARASGVDAADIRTSAGGVGFVGNEAVGWMVDAPASPTPQTMFEAIEIRLHDPQRYDSLRKALEAAGAAQVTGPGYSLNDEAPARAEAKTLAMADARAQAEIYARATNMRLGRMLRISERVAYSMEDAVAMQDVMKAMAGTKSTDAMVETRVRIGVDFALLANP